jgi:hypothetical protein
VKKKPKKKRESRRNLPRSAKGRFIAYFAYRNALNRLRAAAQQLVQQLPPHYPNSALVCQLVEAICDYDLKSRHADDFLKSLLAYAANWKPRGKPSKFEDITKGAYVDLMFLERDRIKANPKAKFRSPTFKEVYMKVLEQMELDHPSDRIERNVRYVLDKNKKEFPLRMWKGSGAGHLQ